MIFVLDPLEGKLYSPHDARGHIRGLYSHGFTTCARRREPGPATATRLFRMLLDFSGSKAHDREFARDFQRKFGKQPPRDRDTYGARDRIELARKIEDLFRRGAHWPKMRGGRDDGSDDFYFTPSALGQTRPRTERPRNGYCLRWNGMLWEPCRTLKERREAGFLPLMMCWPPPVPKSGDYLSSGERARFIYRIVEVERFRPPRGEKKYTCRLWCERVLPEDVPRNATMHTFYWHPRAKRRAA